MPIDTIDAQLPEAPEGINYRLSDRFRFAVADVTGLRIDTVYRLCPSRFCRMAWAYFSGKSRSPVDPL